MFDRLTRLLLVLLPFHVLLSIFFQFEVGIPYVAFWKEIVLLVLAWLLVADCIRRRAFPKLDVLDWLVGGYVAYMLMISLVSGTSIAGIVYGGRYAFEFLFVLILYKHGAYLLSRSVSYYVRLFLLSATIAILMGILVRFAVGEDILLYFWFSANLSNWSLGESIPIYHGIPQANVRRFQGIFDGPNPTAYFLLVSLGALWYSVRTRRDYWGIAALWTLVLLGLILLTYSRSALVGIILASGLTLALLLRTIIKKYRYTLLSLALIAGVLGFGFYLRYEHSLEKIFLREGSTKGHLERMTIGLERFVEKPWGHGLAAAGPGSRHTYDVTALSSDELRDMEDYTIPESWYIQQLVEGWVVAFVLFVWIMLVIMWRTFAFSPVLFWMVSSVLAMNVFLHTFEALYISIALFTLLGIVVSPVRNARIHALRW